METECSEFLCGFCTKLEFFSEGITEQCKLKHDEISRKNFNPKNPQFRRIVQTAKRNFSKILKEVDLKITNNLYLKDIQSEFYQKSKSIDKIETMILESRNDLNRCYNLLLTHGKCIEAIEEYKNKPSEINVCKNCASFYESNQKCENQFHEKYKKLRNLYVQLKNS